MNPPSPTEPPTTHPRLVCFVNGIYTQHIAGGDIYLTHIIRGTLAAGFPVHFFCGPALKWFLEHQKLPANLTLTDKRIANLGDASSIPGQAKMFVDYGRRLLGSLRQLKQVRRDDITFVVSDFWWDVI